MRAGEAATARPSRRRREAWSVNVPLVERQRILRGWTQRQLARSAGVNPDTLTDLFEQRRRPTLGTVQAICTSLDLSLADVIVFESDVDQQDPVNSQGAFSETGGPC
jgi:transcriptional regulator with XRE-family HTH domain